VVYVVCSSRRDERKSDRHRNNSAGGQVKTTRGERKKEREERKRERERERELLYYKNLFITTAIFILSATIFLNACVAPIIYARSKGYIVEGIEIKKMSRQRM